MIHKTAIVHPSARLGVGVEVGPYAVIGPNVEIGDGTIIGAHAVLQGPLVIGRRNRIYPGACLGGDPQHLKDQGEATWLRIGDDNVIREHVTIHRGTASGRGETVVGDRNYIMTHVHIGHDCRIGSDVVLTHGVGLSGFVEVHDQAVIGGMTGLHQFVRVGTLAMIGGCSVVRKDVPPYMLVEGHPARVRGLNSVGLRRRGVPASVRSQLKEAYRLLFRSGLNVSQALERFAENGLVGPEVEGLAHFIRTSRRGLTPGASQESEPDQDGGETDGDGRRFYE